MAQEVWGTFAVNDHRRSQAFLREILLFDRLVVPVPSTDEERERWRRPNSADPSETWDPDRLDELLGVLGTQHEPGLPVGGAVAGRAAADIRAACRPNRGRRARHAAPTASRAAPDDANGLDTLKAAVDLASDPDFASARAEYHAWLREFVQPLQREGAELHEIPIDPASLKLAEERLRDLVARERRVVGGDRRRRRWTRVEWATMAVATTASVGLALMNPVAGLGVLAAVAQFAGWTAGKRAAPPPDRPLSGASLFVAASREEGWARP